MVCQTPGCGRTLSNGHYAICQNCRDEEYEYSRRDQDRDRDRQYGVPPTQADYRYPSFNGYQRSSSGYNRPPPAAPPYEPYTRSQYSQDTPYQQRIVPELPTYSSRWRQEYEVEPPFSPNIARQYDSYRPDLERSYRPEQTPDFLREYSYSSRERRWAASDSHQQQSYVASDRRDSPQHGLRQYHQPSHPRYETEVGGREQLHHARRGPEFVAFPRRGKDSVSDGVRRVLPSIQQSFVPGSSQEIKSEQDIRVPSHQPIKLDPDVKQEPTMLTLQYIKPEPAGGENSNTPLRQQQIKDNPMEELESSAFALQQFKADPDELPIPVPSPDPYIKADMGAVLNSQPSTQQPGRNVRGGDQIDAHSAQQENDPFRPWDPTECYPPQPHRSQSPVFFQTLKWHEWARQPRLHPSLRQYVDPISGQPGQYGLPPRSSVQQILPPQQALPVNVQNTQPQQHPIPVLGRERPIVDESGVRAPRTGGFPRRLDKEQRNGLSRKDMKALKRSSTQLSRALPQRSKTMDENTKPVVCGRCIRSARDHWASACQNPLQTEGSWDEHREMPCASCTKRAIGHREVECLFPVQIEYGYQ